jgi:hypothetical protein
MIILLATDGKYGKGNDFPIFTIPLKMEGATNQSLEDFQWWAYSSDFKKWLDKNPREWVADSEEMTKYGDIAEIIRESLGGSGYSMQKALREINESQSNGRVSKFGEFATDALYEEKGADASAKAMGEKATKFHFAYSKLEADGKLETEYVVKDQDPGKPKAVFLCLEDQETGANLMETLDAYKVAPLKIDNPGAKFRLFEILDRKIGGPIPEDATGPSLAQDAINNGIRLGTYAVAGTAIYAGAKYLGGAYALRRAWKGIKFLRTGKQAADAAKSVGLLKKASAGIKGLWSAVTPMKAISFWGRLGKAGVEGAKLQRALGNMEKAGVVAKSLGMVKGFITGAKAAGGAAKAAEWTNPIGWALLAIDAVGSTWNWYSGKQAPRYGNVEDFAKGSFDPKSIKIGVPITICWSQPAGGWGIAVSFLFSNETRTTMELVKVADVNGKSIFILTQINAKEVQKQIADFDITLIAFDNSDVVDRGWIDNEDLDFEMLSLKKELNSLQNYQGSCDWNLFESEYKEASPVLLISDPNAPEEYEFHFSDSEDNILNVIGKKVSTEELSAYSDEEISRMFGVTASKETESKIKTGEQEAPKEEEVKDSLKTLPFSDLLESRVISKFSDFKKAAYSVLEDDKKDNPTVKGNSAEGSEDADAKSSQMMALTSAQKSGPLEVAMYVVTERDYANPELRGKYETGDFTNFLLDSADWKAKNGDSIEIDPNTDEILEDSKRGLYKYVEPKEEIVKPVVKDEVQDADDDKKDSEDNKEKEPEVKKDDYYIKVDPKDVNIKDRKSSTVVRDTSMAGGINLFDTILTTRDKEALKIENWKTITFAKELRDNRGDIVEVKFRNKYAPFGDKSRKYRVTDGEAFELAKRFVEQTKDRIKYE